MAKAKCMDFSIVITVTNFIKEFNIPINNPTKD